MTYPLQRVLAIQLNTHPMAMISFGELLGKELPIRYPKVYPAPAIKMRANN